MTKTHRTVGVGVIAMWITVGLMLLFAVLSAHGADIPAPELVTVEAIVKQLNGRNVNELALTVAVLAMVSTIWMVRIFTTKLLDIQQATLKSIESLTAQLHSRPCVCPTTERLTKT